MNTVMTHPDLLQYIFCFLQPPDLIRISGVCRKWCKLSRDELVWVHHTQIEIVFPGATWYNYTKQVFEKNLKKKLGLKEDYVNLFKVTKLDLNNNRLTSIPPELDILSTLTRLNLQNNRLVSIPLELGNLSNLTELYLYGNQLSSIPVQVAHLNIIL